MFFSVPVRHYLFNQRANRTMVEGVVAVLAQSGLPHSFWGEALCAFVHVWNRMPSSSTAGKALKGTPFELWYGKKPDLSHLRVWGCRAYAHVQRDRRSKLEWHIAKCVFIGYPDGYKGWKLWDPVEKRVIISETVHFDEKHFPLSKLQATKPLNVPSLSPPINPSPDAPEPAQLLDLGGDEERRLPPAAAPHPAPLSLSSSSGSESESDSPPPRIPGHGKARPPALSSSTASDATLRRSVRSRVKPSDWRTPAADVLKQAKIEEVDEDEESSDSGEESPEDEKSDSQQSSHKESPEPWEGDPTEGALAASASEPRSFTEALSRSDSQLWIDAALEELLAHTRNGTWTLVELPPWRTAVGSHWVFKIKRNPDSTVERYKARLVAKGYSQRPGFDFFETFAGTPKYTAIRTVLALAAVEDLHMRSIDISNAFLNGELEEEVYMRQAEGFERGGPNIVCLLNKALYGLKQASRVWKIKLARVLCDQLGFKTIYSDSSIYAYQRDKIRVLLPVFVDDGTIVSNSASMLDEIV
jgi:hypothetical protein